jgi:hypothetical protein
MITTRPMTLKSREDAGTPESSGARMKAFWVIWNSPHTKEFNGNFRVGPSWGHDEAGQLAQSCIRLTNACHIQHSGQFNQVKPQLTA